MTLTSIKKGNLNNYVETLEKSHHRNQFTVDTLTKYEPKCRHLKKIIVINSQKFILELKI